jgi:hypothetical protein
MQCVVSVTDWKGGPQEPKVEGLAVNVTLVAPRPLTLVLRVTPVVGGAHLKESEVLPVPAPAANVTERGVIDQRAFGWELDANATAAYAPTVIRLMERPTSRCGRYLLTEKGNCKERRRFLGI